MPTFRLERETKSKRKSVEFPLKVVTGRELPVGAFQVQV